MQANAGPECLPRLLVATNNEGKLREYRGLLHGVPFTLVSLAEAGINETIPETGSTFEENARQKALYCLERSGLNTLADDSGLEVDALGGKPGPLSARYAGEGASDRQRLEFLLAQLKDVPWEKRTARFRCVIALAPPGGKVQIFEGECPGRINFEPRGEGGFGYDPIFFLPQFGRTMAELTFAEKNRISHRALAAAKARVWLTGEGEAGKSYSNAVY